MGSDDGASLDDFRDAPKPVPGDENGRVFLDAYDFVDQQSDPPTPLWGTEETTILSAGGLGLLAGRPSAGKTTFVIDVACNLAAGRPYPPREGDKGPDPWPVPRPLRIALVENEGPIEMFRSKLKSKLEVFPVDIREAGGKLTVSTFRWGSFSFADPDVAEKAKAELDADQIDLVIGDPLASLGLEGVGSPAETHSFVQALRPLGLGTYRAFLFLHHFRERVDRSDDELSRLSGAWGGHLDTLLTLSATGHTDQARLAYPKLRWSKTREPSPLVLGRVWNTASFEVLGEEGDQSLLEPIIYNYLLESRERGKGAGGKGYYLATEIAKKDVGVGKARAAVQKALEGAPHLFVLKTGEEASALGRKSSAKLWGLKEWDEDDPFADEPGAEVPKPESNWWDDEPV